MCRIVTRINLACLFVCMAMTVNAQEKIPDIVSPEIHADGSVTFRYYNPQAEDVQFGGGFGSQRDGINGPMERDNRGVWSRTVQNMPSGIYHYTFRVDGRRVMDLNNPRFRTGNQGKHTSMLLVPANPPAAWEENPDIAHGAIVEEKFYSNIQGRMTTCYVYMPPGMRDTNRRYPVLYLLHGGGDDARGWPYDALITNVLDNMIADRTIQPFIGVFPDGDMRYPKDLDWRGDPKLRGVSSERHVTYFITEVMPYVESRYPIRAENSHRILAGLSMGAGQSFQLAIRYPHLFGYVAPLSNGAAVNPDDGYSMAGILPGQVEPINKHIREWYISIGTKDFLLERAQTTHAIFNDLGIKHAYYEREGKAHSWDFWVDSVVDFLPQFSRLIPRE